MYKIYLILVATMLLIPQLSKADDEVIWETEKIPYLHDVLVAPQGDILYNISGKTLQIRRISDGVKIDSIEFDSIPNYLYHMSISADGRYMAFIGDNPFVLIYDLFERKEVKRITTEVYARKELKDSLVVYKADNWVSSSISPDGTKITGVATADGGNMSNFVVIDIASEKTIFEQRRIGYDLYHPINQGFDWKSAEYTPDGKYIVAQLDYGDINGPGPDTVYVYDANTFEIYDKVLNNFAPGNGAYNEISFSSYKPMFTFHVTNHINIYDFQNKSTVQTELNPKSPGLVFSRNSNQLVYAFDFENHIYDLDTKEVIYKYQNPKLPVTISMDNSKLFGKLLDGKIYCLKTFFTTSSIENSNNENTLSPNPTTGILNISINNKFPSLFRYDIISDSGQSILSDDIGFLQSNNNNVNINISSVPTGHYLLRISSDREEFTFNIIKEN